MPAWMTSLLRELVPEPMSEAASSTNTSLLLPLPLCVGIDIDMDIALATAKPITPAPTTTQSTFSLGILLLLHPLRHVPSMLLLPLNVLLMHIILVGMSEAWTEDCCREVLTERAELMMRLARQGCCGLTAKAIEQASCVNKEGTRIFEPETP